MDGPERLPWKRLRKRAIVCLLQPNIRDVSDTVEPTFSIPHRMFCGRFLFSLGILIWLDYMQFVLYCA